MMIIDPKALQRTFALNFDSAARAEPSPPKEWWMTEVLNLAEIGPIIATQYRINAVSCIRALRDQLSWAAFGNLAALRDFAHWCCERYPEK